MVTSYFCDQNIDWLTRVDYEDAYKNYVELITGGIIPELAQRLLSVEERIEFFDPLFSNSSKTSAKAGDSFDKEQLQTLFFMKFINTYGRNQQIGLKKYSEFFKAKIDMKADFMQTRNLQLSTDAFYFLTHKYNPKAKKSESHFNYAFFEKFSRLVKPQDFEIHTHKRWKDKLKNDPLKENPKSRISIYTNWYNEANRIGDEQEKGKIFSYLLKEISSFEHLPLDKSSLTPVIKVIFNEVSNTENIFQYLEILEKHISESNDLELLLFYMKVGSSLIKTKNFTKSS